MNKAKQFIIENSEQFSTAIDNGYDIRMTEAEIFEWMQKYADSEVKKLNTPDVSGSDLVKSDWDLRECFNQLRFDKNHHSGLGDIRLTIAQQEEICDLVERFYHCR